MNFCYLFCNLSASRTSCCWTHWRR